MPTPRSPKKFPLLPVAIAGIVVILLLAVGGFAYASTMEQDNAFCGSCHTQPETTYLQRAAAHDPVDMASYHMVLKGKKCIDCHSGAGLGGHLAAEFQGALNALHYYTGTATQPAVLVAPISDAACLQCHQAVTSQRALNNHFHGDMTKWQAADPQAGSCVSCHSGHSTSAALPASFATAQLQDQPVCDACHQAIRKGTD